MCVCVFGFSETRALAGTAMGDGAARGSGEVDIGIFVYISSIVQA